ncbi:MAG: AAA family ATPase [Elusimicrobiota bacterium]
MSFEFIKGHRNIIEKLKQMIDLGEIPSTIIFYGKDGIGKLMVAKEFAREILLKYCGGDSNLFGAIADEDKKSECENMFDKGIHPDFLLVNMGYQAALLNEKIEDQKSLKIDTLREVIKFSNLSPSFCQRKVIIIDTADKMTIDAQNSMLKTLEEPPQNTVILLVSSNPNLLLPTVLSRCYKIMFKKLREQDVMDILISKNYEFKRAELLAKLSEGSVSIALKYDEILSIFSEVSIYRSLSPFLIVSKLSKRGDFREFANLVINFINAYLYLKIGEGNAGMEQILELLRENFKYKEYIKRNVNTKIILTVVIYKFLKNFNYFIKGVVL